MDTNGVCSWVHLSLIWITLCWKVNANHDAKRLYDDLIIKNNYNKLIAPKANSTGKCVIKLGIKLLQVIDVVSIQSFPCILFPV